MHEEPSGKRGSEGKPEQKDREHGRKRVDGVLVDHREHPRPEDLEAHDQGAGEEREEEPGGLPGARCGRCGCGVNVTAGLGRR